MALGWLLYFFGRVGVVTLGVIIKECWPGKAELYMIMVFHENFKEILNVLVYQ